MPLSKNRIVDDTNVMCFTFDENTSGSIDVINGITLTGNATVDTGFFYRQRKFYGTSQFLTAPFDPVYDCLTGQIDVYFHISRDDRVCSVFDRESVMAIEVVSGKIRTSYRNLANTTWISITGGTSLQTNRVYKATYQWGRDGDTPHKLFLDGVLEGSATGNTAMYSTSGNIFLGVKDVGGVKSQSLSGGIHFFKMSYHLRDYMICEADLVSGGVSQLYYSYGGIMKEMFSTTSGDCRNPDLSSDGNYLCFESNRNGLDSIYVMPFGGNSNTTATLITGSTASYQPRFFNSSTGIVFSRLVSSKHRIYSCDLSGNAQTDLTQTSGGAGLGDLEPELHPSLDRIYFNYSISTSLNEDIYYMDFQGGNRTLFYNGVNLSRPNWNKDGTTMAIQRNISTSSYLSSVNSSGTLIQDEHTASTVIGCSDFGVNNTKLYFNRLFNQRYEILRKTPADGATGAEVLRTHIVSSNRGVKNFLVRTQNSPKPTSDKVKDESNRVIGGNKNTINY